MCAGYAGMVVTSVVLAVGMFLLETEPEGLRRFRFLHWLEQGFLYGSYLAIVLSIPLAVGLGRFAEANARDARSWWPQVHVGLYRAARIVLIFAAAVSGLVLGGRILVGHSLPTSRDMAAFFLPFGGAFGACVAWFYLMASDNERPPV